MPEPQNFDATRQLIDSVEDQAGPKQQLPLPGTQSDTTPAAGHSAGLKVSPTVAARKPRHGT